MQGLILAAGFGRRMLPLSDRVHKALIPIGETTILGRLVDGLHSLGIGTITVVTGHRAGDLKAYLAARYPDRIFRFVHNDRFAETNNIVSLALAMAALEGDEDVVLTECDLLLDASALSPLTEEEGNVALVDEYPAGMDGTVVTAVDGYISEVIPPSRQGAGFDFESKLKTLNVYRFGSDFCLRTLKPLLRWYAEEVDATSYYELVLGMLVGVQGQKIKARMVPPGSWCEVDDPNDLAVARFRFQPEERPAILDRSMGGHWAVDVDDFSFMRNEYFPTPAMFAAMRHVFPELAASYGSSQPVLDEKMAWFVRCDPARIVALSGASQAYPILRRMFAGRRVAIPSPTFGEYPRMFPEASVYPDRLVDAPIEEAAAGADLVVVVNPNNPTGTTVPTRGLFDMAAGHPETVVLVDESFIGFSQEPSIVPMLEQSPLANVLVLTSLSKMLGVPGLRIGYLYGCDRHLLFQVRNEIPVWNMGAAAEFFLELLLKFRNELAESLQLVKRDRSALCEALNGMKGVEGVHAGGGNFVLVRLSGDAASAAALRRRLLAEEGIEVKDVSKKLGDGAGWLRIAARPAEATARLLKALARCLPS